MVSLKKKSDSLMKYYIKVTCAFKWARKLPRKTETYESAKCVPCNTRKCTHNRFVSDLLKWALKCRFYTTGPWNITINDQESLAQCLDSKYLGSSDLEHCYCGLDSEHRYRMGSASTAFGKLQDRLWKNRHASMKLTCPFLPAVWC